MITSHIMGITVLQVLFIKKIISNFSNYIQIDFLAIITNIYLFKQYNWKEYSL